ncbi:MAG: rod shape-determining protein MreD [Nitriliruptoraceae bacterium]
MTRRLAGMAALIVTVLLVQTTVLPVLLRPGFLPDLAAVLAVLVTLERGPRAGLWTAAAAGLAADLLTDSAPRGAGMAVAAVVVIGAGLLRPYLGGRSDVAAVPVAGLAAAAAFLLAAVVRVLLATDVAIAPSVAAAGAAATALLGAVAAPPLLALLRRALGPEPEGRPAGAAA